jgi:hypothetical protein
LLQIYSVQVDEWGAILCADILVKGGFVGEDLTGIAMDGERRGLSCGLPDGVGKLPVLEKSRGVGGYLKTCANLYEFLRLLDYFDCMSGECAGDCRG